MMEVKAWVNYSDFNFEDAICGDEEIAAVIKNIRENAYKFGGNDHENRGFCCPLLSNGKVLRVSWRKWGEIMAMAYNLKSDDGSWNYSLWYMGEHAPEERKFPKSSKIEINDYPILREIIYEVSDAEYKNIINPFLYGLAFPLQEFEKLNIKSFCKIILKFKKDVLLESVVNGSNFLFCPFDQSAEALEDTNFAGFDKQKLSKLNSEDIVVVYIDIIKDNRKEYSSL